MKFIKQNDIYGVVSLSVHTVFDSFLIQLSQICILAIITHPYLTKIFMISSKIGNMSALASLRKEKK